MKNVGFLIAASAMPLAYASGAAAATDAKNSIPAKTDSTASSAKTDTATAAKTNTPLTILGVSTAVQMPQVASRRGSKSQYDFDAVEVGQSIGVVGRTAKNLQSTVTNANRRYTEDKKDANGQTVYKMIDMKDAAGNVTRVPDTSKPEKVQTRHFFAHDCDPATDPDKATARIWRDK